MNENNLEFFFQTNVRELKFSCLKILILSEKTKNQQNLVHFNHSWTPIHWNAIYRKHSKIAFHEYYNYFTKRPFNGDLKNRDKKTKNVGRVFYPKKNCVCPEAQKRRKRSGRTRKCWSNINKSHDLFVNQCRHLSSKHSYSDLGLSFSEKYDNKRWHVPQSLRTYLHLQCEVQWSRWVRHLSDFSPTKI